MDFKFRLESQPQGISWYISKYSKIWRKKKNTEIWVFLISSTVDKDTQLFWQKSNDTEKSDIQAVWTFILLSYFLKYLAILKWNLGTSQKFTGTQEVGHLREFWVRSVLPCTPCHEACFTLYPKASPQRRWEREMTRLSLYFNLSILLVIWKLKAQIRKSGVVALPVILAPENLRKRVSASSRLALATQWIKRPLEYSVALSISKQVDVVKNK